MSEKERENDLDEKRKREKKGWGQREFMFKGGGMNWEGGR